jgi:UDP-glucose 4-epimerase
LVSGGAGFLGVRIVQFLLERGNTVRVFDDLSVGGSEALSPFLGDIEFLRGDLTLPDELGPALNEVDTIVHLAAHRMQKSCDDPRRAFEVNAGGTLSLLELAKRAGVRRIVHASTGAVYGDSPSFPQSESMPAVPVSGYGRSKLAAEEHCRRFGEAGDLETVSLRYFNVYGPGQRPGSQYSGVITAFITQLMEGSPCTIWGEGLQSRDFIYLDDAVDATMAACDMPLPAANVINVGSGSSRSVLEVAEKIGVHAGKDIAPVHLPERRFDLRRMEADTGLMRELLSSKPLTGFDQGLRRTVDWFLQQRR